MTFFPEVPTIGKRSATLWLAASLLFFVVAGARAEPRDSDVETSRLAPSEWLKDGLPFQPVREEAALRSLWTDLEREPTKTPFADASTLQLLKQSALYKGKLLSIKGRLLRADRTPISRNEQGWDLWILLPDSKTTPIRVVARRAPEGFAADSVPLPSRARDPEARYRRETIRANAIYYRTTAYDAGDDFLAAPTLVAESFAIDAKAKDASETNASAKLGRFARVAAITALAVVSLLLKMRRRGGAKRGAASKIGAAVLIALAPTGNASARESERDEFYWGRFARVSREEWREETGDARPRLDEGTPESARRRAAAIEILGLGDNLVLSDSFLSKELARETTARVAGTLESLGAIALNPTEADRLGAETLCRAVVATPDGRRTAAYLAAPPRFRVPETFFDRPRPATSETGGGERVGFFGVKFGSERGGTEAFLTGRLQWFPEAAPLGRAGVDVGAFEAVPVYPRDALERARTDDERKAVARSMRWTTEERRAFYGSLAAFRQDAPRKVRDAREPVGVVSLFNEPEKNQGARVKLRGWVRRVNMILVSDPDVKAATKLDRYWQLFLFTDESQGWPVALCVPELPEALDPTAALDDPPIVEFDGFFYKTWAYRSSSTQAPVDDDAESSVDPVAVKRWTRAPVAIGRIVGVEFPDSETVAPWAPTTIFVAFAALACAWIVLRRLARRPRRDVLTFHSRRNF